MPKGVPPTVLSYWSPESNGVVQNDFFCIGRTSKNPALAHRFIDFMSARRSPTRTWSTTSATRRRRTRSRRVADQERPDPEEPHERRRPPRAVRVQPGAAAAQRRGRALLGRGLVEVQGRVEPHWASSAGPGDCLRCPGVLWLAVFFLIAFYAVIAVAFGNQNTLSEPVPFWNPLDWNVGYMLGDAREHLERRPVPDRLRAHVRLRRDRARALAPDRLSRRLLRGAPRGSLARPRAAAPDPPVLDQLPDADARLDQPALAGRPRDAGS